METLDAIMKFDWAKIIASVIKGLKNFLNKAEYYWPETHYGFEKYAGEKFEG